MTKIPAHAEGSAKVYFEVKNGEQLLQVAVHRFHFPLGLMCWGN
jgi:hypothetical protein